MVNQRISSHLDIHMTQEKRQKTMALILEKLSIGDLLYVLSTYTATVMHTSYGETNHDPRHT